jgi:GNAT superfamily N-acetyltransferase
MKIELIFCLLDTIDDELTLSDLADLAEDVNINYIEDRAEFIIRIVSCREELVQMVKRQLNDDRGSNCLVISDQLTSYDMDKQCLIPSKIANEIFEQIRNSTSVCGLIALTKTITPHIQGIDFNGVSGREGRQELRAHIEKITARLWYKKPPKNLFHHNREHLFSLAISPVLDQDTLQKTLELRGRVYAALGYIDSIDQKSPIEMDAYDLTSIHFIVIDRMNQGRIAGTMRLIIPGLTPVLSMTHQYDLNKFEEWTRNIARNCVDRQWWKAIGRVTPSALPVLNAFTYFDTTEQALEIDRSLMPRNVCELSRVVVAPEYRGMGISSLLINHGIRVAKELRRQYIWLECAPHHIEMYKKYGFNVKKHQGQYFYERAQRLDTWAVAMSLEISKSQLPLATDNTVCYRLLADVRSGNCSLLFQFTQRSVSDVEDVFDSPIDDKSTPIKGDVRGISEPLKKLIPLTLACSEIKNFTTCLKALIKQVKVERLSLQHSNGRAFSFNPDDINSDKRVDLESKLSQWLR